MAGGAAGRTSGWWLFWGWRPAVPDRPPFRRVSPRQASRRESPIRPLRKRAQPRRWRHSPRHGEWVDVELVGSDRPIATWIVRPEGADDAPVVLVIHEIFGLTDWVRAVADRLAENGFVAVVPDLLSGMGADGGGTASAASRDEVVRLIRSLEPADAVARLDAVRDHALALPSTTGTIVAIGFCWGGSTSFAYAVTQPTLRAAVVYYGSSPVETADYHLVGAPVLGLYGGDDERVNATIPTGVREMARHGKHFETEIFDGAGHGFLRAQESRSGADREASVRAWRRTIEFLWRYSGREPVRARIASRVWASRPALLAPGQSGVSTPSGGHLLLPRVLT